MKHNRILILGNARHGKDTLADFICEEFGLKQLSSSIAALDIFLFDVLKNNYGFQYRTKEEAYADRINNRDIWYREICDFNKIDKTRLVKHILSISDIYVGLRDVSEIEQAIEENLFDKIIGVYDYRKPIESIDSNNVDIFKYCDVVFMNNGTIEDLKDKVLEYL